MADDRSNINSASSQRLATDMTMKEQERSVQFQNYLIKPENVMAVWEFGSAEVVNPGLVRKNCKLQHHHPDRLTDFV